MQTGFIYDCSPHFVHSCVLSASLYTGKERDVESGLDNFGPRYMASSMGRFMSTDDFGGHAPSAAEQQGAGTTRP